MKKSELIAILSWFSRGKTGASSECMAFVAAGIGIKRINYPHDPSDFNRCLLLIDWVPEVKDHFDEIAVLCPSWKALIERWDEINRTFIQEAGFDWKKSNTAPNTYALMREILDGVKE